MSTAPSALLDKTRETTPEGCVIERGRFLSPCMGREIRTAVVLPPEYEANPEKSYPVLYTFHGSEAPYDTFSAMVPLRAALREKPMVVTCFDGDARSWYIDAPLPQRAGRDPQDTATVRSLFTTFFLSEFIPALDGDYRIDSAARMLTGFSMGGFGAFHFMLDSPGRFASVSSLSGAFEPWLSPSSRQREMLEPLLGPYEENQEHYAEIDLYPRLEKVTARDVKLPPLLLHCGTEDFLLESNRRMRDALRKLHVSFDYRETPGAHDWPFWRDASAGIVDFHWRSRTSGE